MNDTLQRQRAYRRGLVLGLTMAESVILIIFALLLALAEFLIRNHHDIEQMRAQIADNQANQSKCAVELATARKQLQGYIAGATTDQQHCAAALAQVTRIYTLTNGANNFDDMFKDLELNKHQAQRAAELERQMATLTAEHNAISQALQRVDAAELNGKTVSEKIDHLASQTAMWQQAVKSLPLSAEAATPQAVEQRLAGLLQLDTELSKAMPGTKPAEAVQNMANLQGQVANLRRRLEGNGKGTEKPACWAAPDGRPEYIFDIALHPSGVAVSNNALPHRAEEQRTLPLGTFNFGSEVSPGRFRAAAQPLREWSHQHDCMFFVRIRDRTGSGQKAVYKQKLRTVGEYFYYYEPP